MQHTEVSLEGFGDIVEETADRWLELRESTLLIGDVAGEALLR